MQLTVDSRQLPVGWEIKKLGEVCQIKRVRPLFDKVWMVIMYRLKSKRGKHERSIVEH